MTRDEARRAWLEEEIRKMKLKVVSRVQNDLTRQVDYIYEPNYPALVTLLDAPLGALEEALEALGRRVPIMGSQSEYREGQIDALKACKAVADATLARLPWKEEGKG